MHNQFYRLRYLMFFKNNFTIVLMCVMSYIIYHLYKVRQSKAIIHSLCCNVVPIILTIHKYLT